MTEEAQTEQSSEEAVAAAKAEAKEAAATAKAAAKQAKIDAKEAAKKAAAAEKLEAKHPAVEKDTVNGVTRPAQGVTAQIWRIADELSTERPVTRAELAAAVLAKSPSINGGTVQTQYGRWRKYYSLVESKEERQTRLNTSKEKTAAAKAEVKAQKALDKEAKDKEKAEKKAAKEAAAAVKAEEAKLAAETKAANEAAANAEKQPEQSAEQAE